MIVALFSRLGVTQAETFEHVHGIVEATKQAFRVRDRVVTDPARLAHPLERYLGDKYLDAGAHEIDRRKAAPGPSSGHQGGAVWMGAADASGVVASYVQSIAHEFGSGLVLPRTGVLMQNRGAGFALESGALNVLAPGRVPLQTLSPALALLADGRVLAYGASGGDGEPQTQAAFFTRHVLHRALLEHAIDAPRWLLGGTRGDAQPMLRLESRFEGKLIERLISAGHDVEVLPDAYSDLMGHAGALALHPRGTLEGAHDPRAYGGAAGV
jgi:gamma-glutamyltranspeptidase/glutathione hydrolase